MAAYAEWRAQPEGEALVLDEDRATAARRLVHEHLEAGLTDLGDVGGARQCSTPSGITVLPTEVGDDRRRGAGGRTVDGLPGRAEGGRPGTDGQDGGRRVRHRPRGTGGAARCLGADGRRAWATRCVPALVQPMVGPGVDVAVRIRDHPTVGPVLSLGPGGAAAALDHADRRPGAPAHRSRRRAAGRRVPAGPAARRSGPDGPRGCAPARRRPRRGGSRDGRARRSTR